VFITDDGYLISNNHVVKDAAKVRLLTGAGLIDATVVEVDAANDLALLKAIGRFAPLPIAASRTVKLGGTVATVGFPDIGLQGFALKVLAHGHRVNYAVKNGRAVLPRRPFINRGGGWKRASEELGVAIFDHFCLNWVKNPVFCHFWPFFSRERPSSCQDCPRS